MQPLSSRTVYTLCREAGVKAQLRKPIHPHTLRHAFASHWLEMGVDLRRLQLLLDYQSLRTTSRDLHVTPQALTAIPSPLDTLPLNPPTVVSHPVDALPSTSRPLPPSEVCPACYVGRRQVQDTCLPQRMALDVARRKLLFDTSYQ
jgi:hypothetical protein